MIRTSGSFDSSVHISEEASNAATAVPWAIVYAIGIAGVLGWGMFFFHFDGGAAGDVVSSDQCRARLLHGYRLGLHPQQPDRTAYGDDLLQQLWTEGNVGGMGYRRDRAVSVVTCVRHWHLR